MLISRNDTEAARLSTLERYHLLDTEPEPAFDDLAMLAAAICKTPIALMSLVDAERQWFKAKVGLDINETSRDISFCNHAIRQGGLFVVRDARADERFANNPLVTDGPRLRFYAGIPLIAPGGEALGTLCVIDYVPRDLTPTQMRQLEALGRQVVAQVILRYQLEDDLHESRARKSAILEAAVDCIVVVDHEGKIEEINPSAEATFGYRSGQVIGRHLLDLIAVEDQSFVANQITLCDAAPLGIEPWIGKRIEVPARRSDGSFFPAEVAIACIRQAGPASFVASIRDITERKKAEEDLRRANDELEARVAGRTAEISDLNLRLEQRLKRLDALRQIDMAITGSSDLRLTLGVILDQALAQLRVDAAAVLTLEPVGDQMTHTASKGFLTGAITDSSVRLNEGYAGRSAHQRRCMSIPDLAHPPEPFSRAPLIEGEGFVSYFVAPIVIKGEVKGVLECFHRSPLTPDRDWTSFLETLAGQAALAISNAGLFQDLIRVNADLRLAYDATIEGWSRALDLRDKETEGHTRRVTEMTVRLAHSMGIDGDALVQIRRGSLLHDIGKLGIPDAILLKPGPLTEDERRIMQRHPNYAHEWLSPVTFLRPALEIPRWHHEKWDGTGYPAGLAGTEIPLAARIFAVVDIWDALLSDRPYRLGWPKPQVIEHIQSLRGTHLDPEVVSAFLRLIKEDERCVGARDDLSENNGMVVSHIMGRLEAEREELLRKVDTLTRLAATDDLTGLKNRRFFREALGVAVESLDASAGPLSLLLLDIDRFKSFNDTFGHQAGDDVLCQLATILCDQARSCDLVARLGGEEFAILMPETDVETSIARAERLRTMINTHDWPSRQMTSSIGVATTFQESTSPFALIAEADRALYESKRMGRDRATHVQCLIDASSSRMPRLHA